MIEYNISARSFSIQSSSLVLLAGDSSRLNQSGPPRPSDPISIEPNGIPNRPNRKTQKICVSVFWHFFGLQASNRAETLARDRSRAPRHGKKIEKSAKLPNRPKRSTRSTDRATDRNDRRPLWSSIQLFSFPATPQFNLWKLQLDSIR